MTRRGQSVLPVMAVLFSLLTFAILYGLGLGAWLQSSIDNYITTTGATGLEAFLISYLQVWAFCGVAIGTLVWVYLGGQR
jgi:hypothetical protein